jgi:hypothetical protein
MSQEAAEEQRFNDRLAEAEASIAHLRHCARLQDSATAAVMERAERAEIELAACRKDAERYRWLRDNIMTLPYDDWGVGPQFPSGNELDNTIDNCKEGGK